jgi:transcriptional regulator with XRE-family HTH domain
MKMASVYKTDIKAIKKLMIEKDISTIAELSEKIGVSRNTVSKVLNGSVQPSAEIMDKLVSALDIKPEVAGTIFFSQNLRDT